MDKQSAIKVLSAWDEAGRYVFTRNDLAKLFPDDSAKTLQEAVNRLVKDGWLRRACRGGLCVFPGAQHGQPHG